MEKSEGHFGDRAKLLLDLLAWGDEALNLGDLLARVTEAPTGVQALAFLVCPAGRRRGIGLKTAIESQPTR